MGKTRIAWHGRDFDSLADAATTRAQVAAEDHLAAQQPRLPAAGRDHGSHAFLFGDRGRFAAAVDRFLRRARG